MQSTERMNAVPIGGTIGADLTGAARSGISRRIYIASSWKNAKLVRAIAHVLRNRGHEVFDFTDPENRPVGLDSFVYSALDAFNKPREEIDWLEFLEHPDTERAFKADKPGLNWANTVLMLLPCGRNAHLEAGYGVGRGKDLFILGDLPTGEYEAMYLFSNGCYRAKDFRKLLDRLALTKLQAEGSN